MKPFYSVLFGSICVLFAGCEIKDGRGRVLIEQKPPHVDVKVEPHVTIERRSLLHRHPKCHCCQGQRCKCGTRCGCLCRNKAKKAKKHTARRPVVSPPELPAVNLPLAARQTNWGGGSCTFASTVSPLRWEHCDEAAHEMRNRYSGGAGQDRLHPALESLGVRYAYTSKGDVAFLEWMARTRRAGMIHYFPNHSVTLVDFTKTHAVILDNNRTKEYIFVPRDEFIRKWRRWGGACTVPLSGPPAPPL